MNMRQKKRKKSIEMQINFLKIKKDFWNRKDRKKKC